MRIYRFGAFELDAEARELRRAGVRLHATPQTIALLGYLVEHRGVVIPREQIRALLWPGQPFLEYDQAINTLIRQARRLLNDDAVAVRFIETHPRRGYRFIAPVEVVEPPAPTRRPPRMFLPVLAASVFLLMAGDRPRAAASPARVVVVQRFDADEGGDCATTALALRERVKYELSLLRPAGIELASDSGAPRKAAIEIGATIHCEDETIRAVLRGRDPTTGLERWTQSIVHPRGAALSCAIAVRAATSTARLLIPHPFEGETDVRGTHDPRLLRQYRQAHALAAEHPGRAIVMYDQILRADPDFAEARAGLGVALLRGALTLPCEKREPMMRRARAELTKALALRTDLAEAHLCLGVIAVQWDHKLNAAAASLARATDLEPTYAEGYFWQAIVLSALGQHEPALASIRLAEHLDPVIAQNSAAAQIQYNARRFAEAEATYRAILDDDPRSAPALWGLVITLAAVHRENDALPYLQRLFASEEQLHGLPYDSGASFWTLATAAAHHLGDQPARASYVAAEIACLDPRRTRCLDLLGRSLQSHPFGSIYARVDPAFDAIRDDPRYVQLVWALL